MTVSPIIAEVASQKLNRDDDFPVGLGGELSAAAAPEENGTRPVRRSIDLLASAGLLRDDGTAQPDRTARVLMKTGAVNLSVGRLLEGHVNALQLINRYGTSLAKSVVHRRIGQGAFLGVWGADGGQPVTWDGTDEHLSGAKSRTSGLGTVSHALVTVNPGPEVRLALIDVSDVDRASPGDWNMSGMRATASGSFDLSGIPVSSVIWIGEPGDYLAEPHFVGGVWRIAALQAGAAIGLLDGAAAQLRSMGRMGAEPQKARLMSVLMRAWAGVALVERAALAAVNPDHSTEQCVSASISARLLTEEIGLDAVRAVEQSLGLPHFDMESETGRRARDLSVYLRQAARDAFLQRAAGSTLEQADAIWGIFE